jgi:hypothetical protein
MAQRRKYKMYGSQFNIAASILFLVIQLSAYNLLAQSEKLATIKLDFIKTDSTKTCQATVTSDGKPVAGTEIHLYVKRMYSLLPIGKAVATDSTGVASIDFPKDLPGDKNNMLTVIAKIESDEHYGSVEAESEVKWGVPLNNEAYPWSDRSLSASREKAPMFLVIASISIILVIWGTICYVIFQLFKIKRSVKASKAFKAQH